MGERYFLDGEDGVEVEVTKAQYVESNVLATFDTEDEASAHIETLPGYEDGRYGIDQRAPRFPQLTTCLYCKGILSRDRADAPWAVHGLAGTTYTECPKAPNPEDGPMPPHVPGTKILEPPIPSNVLTEPAPVVIPYIPTSAALGSRHHWSKADHWATRRTCTDCGMTKERFGTAGARNDVFELNGRVVADTARGDRTPPCVPNPAPLPSPVVPQIPTYSNAPEIPPGIFESEVWDLESGTRDEPRGV